MTRGTSRVTLSLRIYCEMEDVNHVLLLKFRNIKGLSEGLGAQKASQNGTHVFVLQIKPNIY